MLRVNIQEAKTNFSRYAKRMKAGETVVISDRNKPFAELRPLTAKQKKTPKSRRMGQDLGGVTLPPDWDSLTTNREIASRFNESKG